MIYFLDTKVARIDFAEVNLSTPLSTVIAVALTFAASGLRAQTITNFRGTGLEVSGAEISLINNSCSSFSGLVNIATNGVITGVINRRNFAATASNSTPATATIVNSRIFGPIALINTLTNHQAWEGGGSRETQTVYGADFAINTSLPGFVIKGRATHRIISTVSTNISYEESWGDGEEMTSVLVTNRTTNISRSVSLEGVTFNGQTRGTFGAYR